VTRKKTSHTGKSPAPAQSHDDAQGNKPKPASRKPRSNGGAPRKGAGAIRDPHAEREAQRYERPIPSREAILALLKIVANGSARHASPRR
jgi:ribonuclease R